MLRAKPGANWMTEVPADYSLAYFLNAPVWLLNKLQYLAHDGQHYSWQQGQLKPVQLPEPALLVLSRSAYDEQHEIFPIASYSALKSILQQREQGRLCYHLIGEFKNGQRRVISFTPKNNLVASCLQAKVVLPVSILVFASKLNGLHHVVLPDSHFYQLNRNDNEFNSIAANPLINYEERALQLLGSADNVSKYSWSGVQLARLWQFALRLPLRAWPEFYNNKPQKQLLRSWLPFAGLSAAFALIYLFSSSALLNQQLEHRQQQLSGLNAEVNSVLDARTALQHAADLVQELNRIQQTNLAAEKLWTVIALAQLNDVTLTLVEGDSEVLRLQGHALSATDWLQLLLSSEVVKTADFSAPVRRDTQRREQFSIVVELKELPQSKLQPAVAMEPPSASNAVVESL